MLFFPPYFPFLFLQFSFNFFHQRSISRIPFLIFSSKNCFFEAFSPSFSKFRFSPFPSIFSPLSSQISALHFLVFSLLLLISPSKHLRKFRFFSRSKWARTLLNAKPKVDLFRVDLKGLMDDAGALVEKNNEEGAFQLASTNFDRVMGEVGGN